MMAGKNLVARHSFIALFSLLISLDHCSPPVPADGALREQAKSVLGILPKNMFLPGESPSADMIHLGQILFSESSISVDGKVSCATCHPLDRYGVDALPLAVGNNGKVNPRNSPTVFNAAEQISEHWIGNRKDVEDQARQAVTGAASFGAPDTAYVEKRLREKKSLLPLFEKAFPSDKNPVTLDHYAKAIGAFERTLVTPAPFDQYLAGENHAISDQAKIGLDLFMKTGCITCHNGPFVGGRQYAKFGVLSPYPPETGSAKVDEGRFAVTHNEADRYVFKVPPLRNVERTGPYFHDGSVKDLKKAIHIMAKIQLGKDLKKGEVDAIEAFLRSLTGKTPS